MSTIENGARVVTLTGPGGSGKTRLAIEAAATLVSEYAAGVYWVELSAVRDASLVMGHVGNALGAKNGVVGHIGEREMLLLVDNLEQVIDAGPELAGLVEECPNLTLLITSRERLRVRGEVEFEVPPLAEPEAIALFCERSGLGPNDQIAQLCARLDSMPLAVELAAARAKALSPSQMLGRLSSRLDLLRGGRDADPRQQTLRATIEWSYDLLSDVEQWLFARLAVFAGTWTLEAAEEICDADLDTLLALVDKSLVRVADERYFMFLTVRDFADELLQASGNSEALRLRHAEHFTDAAEAMHREWMYGTEVRTANVWFRAEQANLRAAVEATADRLDLHLRLLHAIRTHWVLSATELRGWLERALPRAADEPPITHARAFAGFAEVLNMTEDFEAALEYHKQARALYRSLGDDEGVARCLVGRGRDLQGLGRLTEARTTYEEALRTARQAPSPPVIAGATYELAFLALEQRDFELALALAADLEELEPDDWRVSSAVIGLVALERGDAETAISLLKGCVAETHAIGARLGLSVGIDALAAALAAWGDLERAVLLCGFSETLRDSLGFRPDSFVRRLRASVADAGRQQLGEDAYFAATSQGGRMSLDEAVELALRNA